MVALVADPCPLVICFSVQRCCPIIAVPRKVNAVIDVRLHESSRKFGGIEQHPQFRRFIILLVHGVKIISSVLLFIRNRAAVAARLPFAVFMAIVQRCLSPGIPRRNGETLFGNRAEFRTFANKFGSSIIKRDRIFIGAVARHVRAVKRIRPVRRELTAVGYNGIPHRTRLLHIHFRYTGQTVCGCKFHILTRHRAAARHSLCSAV